MSRTGEKLVGTWNVISFSDSLSNGGVFYQLGEKPSGGIIYTADGFMSLQLAREPRPTFAAGYQQATRDEIKNALEAYVAYYGTYRIDEQESIITHHVLGSLWPDMIGTNQVRPFELSGDRFTLKPPPFEMDGVVHTRRLVLERVRPPQ
jgi:hypothetical protein